MKSRALTSIVLCAVVSASSAAGASLSADLKKAWQQHGLLRMTVDAMPEASFSFKPTPEQRSFGEQALHVAGANSFLMSFVGAKVEGRHVESVDLRDRSGDQGRDPGGSRRIVRTW